MIELWIDIPGYETYYQVSNMGNVRSLDRAIKRGDVAQFRKGRQKTLSCDKDGYQIANLSKDGVTKKYKVHRLVADRFVSGYFDGAEVNHIDFNRENNSADNLEWVSHKGNIRHTASNGRHYSQSNVFLSNNPNKDNHVLRDRYSSDKELSKLKQSRPGGKNGRARAVAVTLPDGVNKGFECISECAQYIIDSGYCKSTNRQYISVMISSAMDSGDSRYGCTFK